MMDSLFFYSYIVYFIYYYSLLFYPFYSFSLHKIKSEEITSINEISCGALCSHAEKRSLR